MSIWDFIRGGGGSKTTVNLNPSPVVYPPLENGERAHFRTLINDIHGRVVRIETKLESHTHLGLFNWMLTLYAAVASTATTLLWVLHKRGDS